MRGAGERKYPQSPGYVAGNPDEGIHDWFKPWPANPNRSEWECCRKCGVTRRADGKNRSCRGVVKVELRYPSAPGYVAGSATSEAAAESILPHLGELHQRVYRFIRNSGGCTDEEIVDGLRLPPSTARPRRVELVAHGFVEDSGHTKRGRSNRPMTIWRITNKRRAD